MPMLQSCAARAVTKRKTITLCLTSKFWRMQGDAVRLETANAALLQKSGESWQEALAEEHAWELVDVLIPQSQLQHWEKIDHVPLDDSGANVHHIE